MTKSRHLLRPPPQKKIFDHSYNLIWLETHMGWHLCNDSKSDSREVLPLCKGIHWLGYGSPVGNKRTIKWLLNSRNGSNIVRQSGTYAGHMLPVWLRLNIITHMETHGLWYSMYFVPDSLDLSSLMWHVLLCLCSNCHLSNDCFALLCALVFATHTVLIVYEVWQKVISM